MLSDRPANVFSRIMSGWEPCLSACENYCAAKGIQYPADCTISSIVLNARHAIASEYDGFADKLGRSFASGDKLFDQDLDTLFAGSLRELYDLILAQLSSDTTGNSNGTKTFSTKPSTPRLPSDPQQWRVKGEALARASLESTLTALRNLASRQGYVLDQKPVRPQPPLSDPDVVFCKGALLLQKSNADIHKVVQQQSSGQHYLCLHCFLEISNFESTAATCTPDEWTDIISCHVLACPSFKDRRAAYCCHACFAQGRSFIINSAATMRDHLRDCPSMRAFKTPAMPSRPSPRPEQQQQQPTASSPNSRLPSHTPSMNASRNPSPRGVPALQPSPYLGPEDARSPRYEGRRRDHHDTLRPQTPQGPSTSRPRTPLDRPASPGGAPGAWYSPPSSATINRAGGTPEMTDIDKVRDIVSVSQGEAAQLLRRTGGNVEEAIALQLDAGEDDGEDGVRPELPTRERYRNPY